MYLSACIGNMNEYPYSGLVHRNSHHSSQLISIFYMKVSHHSTSNTSLNCVLKTQVKLPRGILFLSLLQKIGIQLQNKLPVIRIYLMKSLGYKRILRNRQIHKEFNFSCEPCTKYVGKPFTRHSIWSLASLVTKSHGTRERFTNLYLFQIRALYGMKPKMHAFRYIRIL